PLDVRQLGLGEGERPADALEQRRAVPLRQGSGELGDLREIRGRARQRFRHAEQGVVPDDAERGLVLLTGDGLAPAVQLAQRGERAWCQRSRSLQTQERIGAVRCAGPTQRLEARALLLRPGQTTELGEAVAQRVTQGGEVLGVGRRIFEHRGRQRVASWTRKIRSRYRWKLAASVSAATSGSRRNAATVSASASGVRM